MKYPQTDVALMGAYVGDNCLDGFFIFGMENPSVFTKQDETWLCLTTVSTVFQSIWHEIGPRELSCVSAQNRCMASSCRNRTSDTFLNAVEDCVKWLHLAIFNMLAWQFFRQRCLRNWRSNKFNSGFCPWHLLRFPWSALIFSRYSTEDSERPKISVILCWWIHFLYWLWIPSQSSAHNGEPQPVFACKVWAFGGCSFYSQSWPLTRY